VFPVKYKVKELLTRISVKFRNLHQLSNKGLQAVTYYNPADVTSFFRLLTALRPVFWQVQKLCSVLKQWMNYMETVAC